MDKIDTFGTLVIKMFIALESDHHGRDKGTFRTVYSRYMDRNKIPEFLAQFSELNPKLPHERIEVFFHQRTHYPY